MKKYLFIILISAILIAFPMQSAYSASSSSAVSAASSGAVVTAKAASEYVFTVPFNTEVSNLQAQTVLGNFIIGDLFLENDEWLTLTMIPGTMSKTDDSSVTLPYQVIFSPPSVLNESNIGDTYSVTVEIDPDDLESAPAGTYQAVLRFRIMSYPDGVVVWEGTTTVTAEATGQEESVVSSTPSSSQSASSQATTSSKATSSKTTVSSKASQASSASAASEAQPGESPNMGYDLVMYGLPVAALILLILILFSRGGHSRKRRNRG